MIHSTQHHQFILWRAKSCLAQKWDCTTLRIFENKATSAHAECGTLLPLQALPSPGVIPVLKPVEEAGSMRERVERDAAALQAQEELHRYAPVRKPSSRIGSVTRSSAELW